MRTVVIDFETYYDKDYSLSNMTTAEYVLDPRFEAIMCGVKVDSQPTEVLVLDEAGERRLHELLAEPARIIAHNAQFDLAILAWYYGIVPEEMFCTMMGARAHIVPFSHSMSLAKASAWVWEDNMKRLKLNAAMPQKGIAVQHMKGKRRSDMTAQELETYKEYCARDVDLCALLYQHQKAKLTAEDQRMVELTIRKAIVPQLWIDRPLLQSRLLEIQAEKQALLRKTGMNDRKTLMSNEKFANALGDLGVDPPTKISPTTGKAIYAFAKTDPEMQQLLEDPPTPAVGALVAARLGHRSTIEETRIQRLLDVSRALEGELPFPLLWFGAHTGRFSGTSYNLQNLPRGSKLREAILPAAHHKLVVADLSQIEARVLAVLADEKQLVDAFAKGVDVYSQFASTIYNQEITADTHPDERFVGKTSVLGLGYGCGPTRFLEMIRLQRGRGFMNEGEAASIVTTYRTEYPRIPALWRRADNAITAMMHGMKHEGPLWHTGREVLFLPAGRVLYYPKLERDAADEVSYVNNRGVRVKIYGGKLIENVVQAVAQLVIRDAELRLADIGYFAAGQSHDELIYCIPEDVAHEFADTLRQEMIRQPDWADAFIPLDCKVHIVDNYKQAK